MAIKVRAKFDGQVFVPLEPINLPIGEMFELTFDLEPKGIDSSLRPLQKLAELAKQFPPDPQSPGDAAAQHDHYLYGTPKRKNP